MIDERVFMNGNEPIRVLRPPKRTSLVDLAYEAIVEAIIDRRFQPGSQLGIDWLAAELQMSNTPVREALARGAALRLVIQNNNRGFTVSPMLSEAEFHHIFEVRHLLEIHALSACDLKSQQNTIDELTALVARMPYVEDGPLYRDFREFNRMDHLFHRALVSMSNNTFLVKSWDDLHFHLHVGRLYSGAGVIDFKYGVREHQEILNMLRIGDRGGLIAKASQHIKQAEQRLHSYSLYFTPNNEQENHDT
jgi:DNA-binding GntR family transcriptional regulator